MIDSRMPVQAVCESLDTWRQDVLTSGTKGVKSRILPHQHLNRPDATVTIGVKAAASLNKLHGGPI
jgi:hypothetical protein